MSEETERQLFHPFFSTGGDLGNGLALHILNEIVERHSGRLSVEIKSGIGTTMRLTLPNVPPEKTLPTLTWNQIEQNTGALALHP